MSLCQITLSANAGTAIQLGSTRLWVDALHNHKVSGFSTLTPSLQAAVAANPDFAAPNLLFYTHCHPDHFSPELTRQALNQWPMAQVVLPEQHFAKQRLLSSPREQLLLSDVSLQFVQLPHEGTQFSDIAHYGCILRHGGFQVLIPGDCEVASPVLAELLSETGPVDLALLDFPWVTLRKGRHFIEQYIRPRHLVIYHLPFASNDLFGYRRAAVKAASMVKVPDIRLLLAPLQREIF